MIACRRILTSRVGKALIKKVLVLAMALIVVFAVIIGLLTYTGEVKKIEKSFTAIEKNYLAVIEKDLWIDDREGIDIILQSICNTPGIEYAAIYSQDTITCSVGRVTEGKGLLSVYPVTHEYNQKTYTIGHLHLKGSQKYVFQKTIQSALSVMAAQTLIIVIVCTLMLQLLYGAVIDPLLKVTVYTSTLSSESLDTPLQWDRQLARPDELDKLADTVNHMRGNLHRAFAEKSEIEEKLRQHRNNLEQLVTQRTLSLESANERLQEEISERVKMIKDREKLIAKLETALSEIRQLSGMLPICAYCKKIRDDKGYWNQIEAYIQKHTQAQFSHSICQECAKHHYPDMDIYDE
jgi:methyl-accepting chemotaxis protein